MAAKLKKKSKKVRKISHCSASVKISVDTAVSVLKMHEEDTSSSASSSGYRGSIESVSSTSTSIDSQVELAENASVRRLNISGECRFVDMFEYYLEINESSESTNNKPFFLQKSSTPGVSSFNWQRTRRIYTSSLTT